MGIFKNEITIEIKHGAVAVQSEGQIVEFPGELVSEGAACTVRTEAGAVPLAGFLIRGAGAVSKRRGSFKLIKARVTFRNLHRLDPAFRGSQYEYFPKAVARWARSVHFVNEV